MDLLGEAAWHTSTNRRKHNHRHPSSYHLGMCAAQPASSQASNLVAASPKRTFQWIGLKRGMAPSGHGCHYVSCLGFVGPNFDAQMQAANASPECRIKASKVLSCLGTIRRRWTRDEIYQHIGQLRQNMGPRRGCI